MGCMFRSGSWSRGVVFLAASAAFALAGAFLPAIAAGSAVTGPRTRLASGLSNRVPEPDYRPACYSLRPNSPKCLHQTLAAIDHARQEEGLRKPMILPRHFDRLTMAEQTFVISDLERVDRGLRPFAGLARTPNDVAHNAAVTDVDPDLPTTLAQRLGARSFAANWAGDFGPLAAD